jgi:adenylate cyclase
MPMSLRTIRKQFSQFLINIVTSGKYSEKREFGMTDYLIRYVLMNTCFIFGGIILLIYAMYNLRRGMYDVAAACAGMAFLCIGTFFLARTKIRQGVPASILMIFYGIFCVWIVWIKQSQGVNFLFIYIYPLATIMLLGMRPGVILSTILLALVSAEMLVPGLSNFNYHIKTSTRMLASYFLVFSAMIVIETTRKTKDRLIEAQQEILEKQARDLQYFNNSLRRAFSTYLSEDVVEEIISDPTRLKLGGIKRDMTALFTDIRGFTRIAETLTPEQLVDMLNYYLSSMSDIILDHKGTIDKYQGDAIISFFGAPLMLPDHALRACDAAIIMKNTEKEINKYIMKKGMGSSPLLTRIGIGSGEMVVGNMGTEKKMNYTIMGNSVNLAARLEGVNKHYGTWILASEKTVQQTGERFLTRRLDRIRVVGMNEPVRIYELLALAENADPSLKKKLDLFHNALELFEKRDWSVAAATFRRILDISPNDPPSVLYFNRCRSYLEHSPDSSWDGVYNLKEK